MCSLGHNRDEKEEPHSHLEDGKQGRGQGTCGKVIAGTRLRCTILLLQPHKDQKGLEGDPWKYRVPLFEEV